MNGFSQFSPIKMCKPCPQPAWRAQFEHRPAAWYSPDSKQPSMQATTNYRSKHLWRGSSQQTATFSVTTIKKNSYIHLHASYLWLLPMLAPQFPHFHQVWWTLLLVLAQPEQCFFRIKNSRKVDPRDWAFKICPGRSIRSSTCKTKQQRKVSAKPIRKDSCLKMFWRKLHEKIWRNSDFKA